MSLLSVFDIAPLADGRQSAGALKVRRGAGRLLRELGFAVVPEVTLSCGRRADLVALGDDGEIWIVEIKSSVADFRADAKWLAYRRSCDRLWFASLVEVGDIFPADEGLILTDGYAAEIVRPAATLRLQTQARRAMHLRVAQTAARRLHHLEDPRPEIAGFA